MQRIQIIERVALGLTIAGALACFDDQGSAVLGPRLTGSHAIFQNYVAIGNSITAGWQSSGISDATQRQSFAFLLAQQMGTRYAYASLRNPGCPAPVINFQTQARPTGAPPCALRDAALATDILNNVAVPNASSFDPIDADGTPFSNALTSFILGGRSQVQRALDADPTFATIWVGNNDVLGFAVQDARTNAPTGIAGMTTATQFQTNYDAMVAALLAGAPDLEGVLIGVVQVANAPIMFPAAAMSNPVFKAGFDAIAGTATTLDPSCLPAGAGAASLINTFMAHAIRAGLHPPVVACVPGGATGTLPAPLGDQLVLDPSEQATVSQRITAYNTYIQQKASQIGFAYFDPNPTLSTLRAGGTIIRNTPNWAATSADAFGTGMSLDGAHPGPALHRMLANLLIPIINAQYNTTLSLVP